MTPTLCLALKALVELYGPRYRLEQEMKCHGKIDMEGTFQDLGEVIYDGVIYYGSIYRPKPEPVE